MIPAWHFALPAKRESEEFDFNCKGTEVHVHGVLEEDGWVISARVYIFGYTAYGYNRFHTEVKDSWRSVLLAILQQVINQHGSFVGGKYELLFRMKRL